MDVPVSASVIPYPNTVVGLPVKLVNVPVVATGLNSGNNVKLVYLPSNPSVIPYPDSVVGLSVIVAKLVPVNKFWESVKLEMSVGIAGLFVKSV